MVRVREKLQVAFLLFLFSRSLAETESEHRLSYFKLVFVWPNSYCNSHYFEWFIWCKKPIPQEFKFHGFIPIKRNNLHVERHDDSSFPKAEFGNWNFSQDLYSLWPNLDMRRSDIDFWEREWDKHGSCSKLNAEDYFYLAVQYAKSYRNLFNLLLQSNVAFSSNHSYKREVLHDGITKVLGSSPNLICSKTKNATVQLKEVQICIHARDGMAIRCPFRFSKCGNPNTLVLFITPARNNNHSFSKADFPASATQQSKLIANQTHAVIQ